MTVRELIKILEGLEQDMEITTRSHEYGEETLNYVRGLQHNLVYIDVEEYIYLNFIKERV